MYVLSKKVIDKLSKKFWDYDDVKDYPILEVTDIDWVMCDEYIRSNFYLYMENNPEDYMNITAYSFKISGQGIVTEFHCQHLDGHTSYYYWIGRYDVLYDRETYDNWETQVLASKFDEEFSEREGE